MEQHTKEYFLSLLQTPIVLFTEESPPSNKPEAELRKILERFTLSFEERLIPKEFGSHNGDVLDLSGIKTISFSFEATKAGQILEIQKNLSQIKCVIVQSMEEYELWKDVVKEHPITIVGFKQGHACFINNNLYEDASVHPFFIVGRETIPKGDITDWDKWSPAVEE